MTIVKITTILALLHISLQGYAQINCKSETAGYRVCQGEGLKQVIVRRMPSWNGQASLMMMDICSLPRHVERHLPDEGYALTEGTVEFPEGTHCQQQYCSEDHEWFSISADAVTLLLPQASPLEVELSLTFSWQKFELRCEQY